ncbi:MAG: hypothetical protein EPN93_20275 [Spirochaetes bacterium]|nr:MAG: hypothetical protein EPN93_20275 [Spirochaetota bacterium]
MKKAKKPLAPLNTEFTDADGTRWIQTSTEDLFSVKELNQILESVEKDRQEGEIVLARIDFQRVNKEYYDTVQNLQNKLTKRTELLKKLIIESKTTIDRKNKKLKELIEYIKKLHVLLAYYKLSPEHIDKFRFTPELYRPGEGAAPAEAGERPEEIPTLAYSEVEELLLDDEGEEIAPGTQ